MGLNKNELNIRVFINTKNCVFYTKKVWDTKVQILCVKRMQKVDRRSIPLPCQINFSPFRIQKVERRSIPLPCQINFTGSPFRIQKINRRSIPFPCQINFRFLWDTEDQQEIHTITMLDQLKVPLGYRRSIGDTHYYHVRSTLGSFGIQKINRRYTLLPCQINLRFLWDTEDQQEIHTITMLDQLQVPLGYRRSIGDPYHFHVRSTLGSFGIQKVKRRSIPLPCQINFRFLWDTEDQQEIHTISMLDQLQVPLGYRRSIGDPYHFHVRSTLGSFGIQKINRRSIPLPCQINFRFLWDTEDQQEIHTISMLDQLKVPLGYRRSIGDPYHYHVRST